MKKIPMRKCVATNEQLPKKDLLRIVRTPNGDVVVDTTGKVNGKGAYIKKSEEALNIALKKGSLQKSLEVELSDENIVEIRRIIRGE